MSGYNNLFNFNTPVGAHDMPGSLNAEPTLTMDQSGNWNAAPSATSELMGCGAAAQLHARLDFAPFEGARSSGACASALPSSHAFLCQPDPAPLTRHSQVDLGAKHACAECLAPFPSDSALHQHAKATEHPAYKCVCGTGFSKYSTLQRHINTKDAPKIFACNLCDDSFNRKDKLKDHCRHYHKVKDVGLRFLFDSQEQKARPGASSRRRRGPVPLAAASSALAPTLAPAIPPAVAPTPAPAGPAIRPFAASTGQQDAGFLTGPSIPAGPFATTPQAIPANDPAADFFTAALTPSEDISGLDGDFLGDAAWATGFGGFNF